MKFDMRLFDATKEQKETFAAQRAITSQLGPPVYRSSKRERKTRGTARGCMVSEAAGTATCVAFVSQQDCARARTANPGRPQTRLGSEFPETPPRRRDTPLPITVGARPGRQPRDRICLPVAAASPPIPSCAPYRRIGNTSPCAALRIPSIIPIGGSLNPEK